MRAWLGLMAVAGALLALLSWRHTRATDGPAPAPPALVTLAPGELAYVLPRPDAERREPARVVALLDGTVRLRPTDGGGETEAARALLVPLASLAPRDVVDPRGACRRYGRVKAVAGVAVTVECDGDVHDVPAERLWLPVESALATARVVPWLGSALGTLCLVLVGVAARARRRASAALCILDGEVAENRVGTLTPPKVVRPHVEVLRCGHCGAPVPLAVEPRTRCPSCREEVEQPPAYRELRTLWAREQATAEREERAVRFAERIASPLFAWALRLGGAALFLVPLAIVVLSVRGLLSDAAAFIAFLATWPLLVAPLPLFAAARGVETARHRLRPTLAFLSALADPKGVLVCRNCGAPLDTEIRGVATVCFYCFAQNLVREKVEVDLDVARRLDRTMTVTIGLAGSIVRQSLWERCALATLLLAALAAPLYIVMALSF